MFKPDAIYYENAIKGYELGVYLLEKYKYNLKEVEIYLNTMERNSDVIKYRKKLYKSTLLSLKKRVLSVILSITILFGVSNSIPKVFKNTDVSASIINTVNYGGNISFVILSLYLLYRNGKKVKILDKELHMRKEEYESDYEVFSEFLNSVENIIGKNDELRRNIIKLYRELNIYDFNLIISFDDLMMSEEKLKRKLSDLNERHL